MPFGKRSLRFVAAALFLLCVFLRAAVAADLEDSSDEDGTVSIAPRISVKDVDSQSVTPQSVLSPEDRLFDFDDEIFFDSAPSDLLPVDFSTANEADASIFSSTPIDEFQAKSSFLQASFCRRFKQDPRWKRQFLYLFLYSLNWPLYTRKKFWEPPLTSYFFKLVLTKTISLNELDKSNTRVARFLKRSKKCGFQTVIQEELPTRTDISDYETFIDIINREKAVDPHFAEMVGIVPDLKLSLDEGPAVIGYVVQQVSDILVMYSYANTFTISDMHTWARMQFRQYQRSMTTVLELLNINNVQITDRPMGGILVLRLSRIVDQALLSDLHSLKQDDPTLELKLERFEAKLKAAIVDSVRLLLVRMSMLVESNWLGSRNALMAKFPDVIVTAYRARGPNGPQAVIERGDFGSEISERVLAGLVEDLKANELYVQLSVADPITHPLLESVKPHIPALKAARMFRQSLEDDPSLPGVGLASVAYATFNDLQFGEAVGGSHSAPYDPDLHLLVHVPQEQFKGTTQFHSLFMAAVTIQPLAYSEPKHVGAERVQVLGFAKKIPGSKPMRMGKFGNGLPYSEQILIDQLICKHSFVVHVIIIGLRKELERKEAEATGEEIYKRFRSRTRGTFFVVFIEPVKPQEAAEASEVRDSGEGYPAWVLGVAVGTTAFFFVALIACLVVKAHVQLPWWIACFCSPHAPFAKDDSEAELGIGRGSLRNCVVEGSFPGERVSLSRSGSFRASDADTAPGAGSLFYGSGKAQSMRSLATYNSAAYPSKNRLRSGVHDAAIQNVLTSAWDVAPLASLEGAHSRRLEAMRLQQSRLQEESSARAPSVKSRDVDNSDTS